MKRLCIIIIAGLLAACGKLADKDAACGSDAWLTQELTFRHLTTSDGLADNEVKAIWQGADGMMRIETATGISLYDGQQILRDTLSQSRQSSGHDFTYQDQAGTLWKYSTLHETVSYKTTGGWKEVELPSDKRQGNYIRGIQDAGDGRVWIATDHQGLYLYDKGSGQLRHYQNRPEEATSLGEDHISTIFVSDKGVLWVGHVKKGVSYYAPSAPRFLSYKNKDWQNVSAILEDHKGNLWIGTDGYGLICKQPYSDKVIHKVDVPGNIVVSLMEDRKGRLWIGTYLHGLLCYDNGETKHYTKKNSGLADNSVYCLQEDDGEHPSSGFGHIWIGTLWGCLQRLTPETSEWESFPGASQDESTAMCLSHDGSKTLYAGTLAGLCQIDIETGTRRMLLGNRQGKPFQQKDIQSLYRDSRGLLWMGHSKGVTIWDEATDSLTYLNKQTGLCDDVVRGIAEDEEGRVWITTGNGCSVVSFSASDSLALTIDNYSQYDGLTDNNFSRHSVIRLSNGDMVLGSVDGYSVVCLADDVERDREQAPSFWRSLTLWLFVALLLAVAAYEVRWYRHWRRMRQKAAREQLVSPSELEITSQDEQLIQKAVKAVEDNLTNDFTVEDLAAALGMTRGHLYRKMMTITGKGPADFIRTIRLKRARQLLDESGMQIAEITYAVGYSSPKVFSRNFKAKFGVVPSDYLKNKGDNTSDTPN